MPPRSGNNGTATGRKSTHVSPRPTTGSIKASPASARTRNKPGFKNVIIQPAIVGDITWVKAHHDGPYGRITSHWKREGNRLTMEVTIPPNSTATVYVPGKDAKASGWTKGSG